MLPSGTESSPLGHLAALAGRCFDTPGEAIVALLALGREVLGVSTMVVARISSDVWEVHHVDDDAFGLVPGLVLPIDDTYCRHVLASLQPLLINDAPNDPIGCLVPATVAHGVGAYAGVPLLLGDGGVFGTLVAMDPHSTALGAPERETLVVLARLVAHELDRDRLLATIRDHDEQRFRAVIDSATDAIVTADAAGTIVDWNGGAERIFGYGHDEVVGQPVTMLMPAAFHDTDQAGFFRVQSGGEPPLIGRTIEVVGQRKDGTTFPGELSLSTWNRGDGPHITAIMRDVTDRRRVEDDLREREEYLRTLTGALAEGLIVQDADDRVTFCNQSAERILGVSAAEMIGLTLFDSRWTLLQDNGEPYPPDRLPSVVTLRTGERCVGVSVGMRFAGGDERWLSISTAPLIHTGDIAPYAVIVSIRDVTAQRATERALVRNEARYRSLVRNSSEIVTLLDATGVASYQSPAVTRELGWQPEDLVGENVFSYVHPDDLPLVGAAFGRLIVDGGMSETIEYRFRHQDGSWRWLETIGTNLLDDPAVAAIVVNSRDVTSRRESSEMLREAEARYRSLVEQLPAVVYRDAPGDDGIPLYVSPQSTTILGRLPEEWPRDRDDWIDFVDVRDRERIRTAIARTALDEVWDGEYRYLRPDGAVVWVHDQATIVHDRAGEPRYWQGIILDVTERKELETRLAYQALHDPLTGLPNRTLFLDRLRGALAHTDPHRRVAVIFLDLDDFKVVNDGLGHAAGDELLMLVSERLRGCAREGDVVARLGGDEFTFLLDGEIDQVGVATVADRIVDRLRPPFHLGDRHIVVTPSIGIATGSPGHEEPNELLRRADIALYQAKGEGKARWAMFDPDADDRALERLRLEGELRRALSDGELRLVYQPIVDLSSGQLREVEALVRWQHPERGLLLPAEFIPVAEATGLVIPLGQWVLEESCRQLREWQRRHPGRERLGLSINLAAMHFREPSLPGDIGAVLTLAGIDPGDLRVEITERVALDATAVTARGLQNLRDMGIKLAVDDFGTGYSGLSALKAAPIDAVKIDRSFVAGLGRDADDAAIVRAIVAMTRALGLSTIAEGIETTEQLAALRAVGCDRGQGYLFARPVPADQIDALLRSGASLPLVL